jgi:hypothetical protein
MRHLSTTSCQLRYPDKAQLDLAQGPSAFSLPQHTASC